MTTNKQDELAIAIESLSSVSLDFGKRAKILSLSDVHTPEAIPDSVKLEMALQPYKDKALYLARREVLRVLSELEKENYLGTVTVAAIQAKRKEYDL